MPETLYSDSFTYVPSECSANTPEGDTFAGCDPPSNFFTALLDNHFFWANTWQKEGKMELALPSHGGTHAFVVSGFSWSLFAQEGDMR